MRSSSVSATQRSATEGGDTTPASHTRKGPVCAERRSRNFGRNKKITQPSGVRRLGAATRISASLSEGSLRSLQGTHGQAPKAAKFAVLPPGHTRFPKRNETVRGSDTTPIEMPHVSPCEPMCRLLRGRVASCRRGDFAPVWANLSKIPVRRKEQEKGIGAFRANAYSQQPAVRAAARVCGFWKLTLFSRFPERFDAKLEKSRRNAPCHNGLRRRFDRKSVRFIPL